MAPSKLRKAIGAVKDRTSIGLARVNSSDSISDIDVAIVKATRHEEYPCDEKHIREILSLTSHSQANVSACVTTISKRLSKTKNWVVALKTLMLIERLVTNGDQSFADEIFFSTRRGTHLLNMSDFRDTSRSNSWDYSAFVRTYALYLDENLEFRMQNRRGKHCTFGFDGEEVQIGPKAIVSRPTPVDEMETEEILSRVQHLMNLLERFLACRPTGAAKTNRVVIVALSPIVKESFHLYDDTTKILGILIGRFMKLDIPNSLKVREIFCRASKQHEQLDMFYSWCKKVGIARSSDYPAVEIIPQKKLEVMDESIRDKFERVKNRKVKMPEPGYIPAYQEPKKPEPKPKPEEERFPEQTYNEKQQPEKQEKQNKKQENVSLLNLGGNAPTIAAQRDKMALTLFDGNPTPTAPTSTNSSWVAFNDSQGRETSLKQSASHLLNQQPTPGRFNQLMLDLMCQQGDTQHMPASSCLVTTGSARSIASRAAERPALQTLPAPPGPGRANALAQIVDPFAASRSMAPPPYLQWSELEKKQSSQVQEQVMWQQYSREGMQGEVGLTRVQQHHPYNTGGYTHTH